MSNLLSNYNNNEYSQDFQKMMNRALTTLKKQSMISEKSIKKNDTIVHKPSGSVLPRIANIKYSLNPKKR